MRDFWLKLPPWLRAVLPGLLLCAVTAVAFAQILEEVVEREAFVSWDEPLIEWMADHRTAWLTSVMTFITNVFGPVVLPILLVIGAGLWGWRTKSWRDPLLLVGAMIFSTAATSIAKNVVGRARPSEEIQAVPGVEHSFSFPSGHTTGAATLVLVTGYLLWRHSRSRRALVVWAVASVLITGLVALTRMYLGYHFLSDVLAGALVGLFTLGLVMCVDRLLDVRRG
ncbi:phosphatase PAP2 family protein [Demequina globuliformis]|uniref:phosphatase PAP2 family protein n=1 Tax=Demequina globuliformis TaxID=676202 RepID=UPI00078104D0|nr:phosphatase PAP2 family protein [Demequina globuliformis]